MRACVLLAFLIWWDLAFRPCCHATRSRDINQYIYPFELNPVGDEPILLSFKNYDSIGWPTTTFKSWWRSYYQVYLITWALAGLVNWTGDKKFADEYLQAGRPPNTASHYIDAIDNSAHSPLLWLLVACLLPGYQCLLNVLELLSF